MAWSRQRLTIGAFSLLCCVNFLSPPLSQASSQELRNLPNPKKTFRATFNLEVPLPKQRHLIPAFLKKYPIPLLAKRNLSDKSKSLLNYIFMSLLKIIQLKDSERSLLLAAEVYLHLSASYISFDMTDVSATILKNTLETLNTLNCPKKKDKDKHDELYKWYSYLEEQITRKGKRIKDLKAAESSSSPPQRSKRRHKKRIWKK